MSKTAKAMDVVAARWEDLQKKRPEEDVAFAGHDYRGINYESISQLLDRWRTIILELEKQDAWIHSPELAIADQGISEDLAAIANRIQDAFNNGVAWLAQSDFVRLMASANEALSAIAIRRVKISRELAKQLSNNVETNADRVILAAQSASKVVQNQEKASAIVDNIEKLKAIAGEGQEHIEEAKHSANVSLAELRTIAEGAQSVASTAEQAKSDAIRSEKEISALHSSISARQSAIEGQLDVLKSNAAQASGEAVAAIQQIQEALRLARAQGLAKSFQDRSLALKNERRLWILGFFGAAAILVALAIVFAIDLGDATYHALTVALLRKLALAAPAVWIGWYCARQIARVSQIQEDYEYKAASALAYQAYKEEVFLAPDEKLRDQLLARAIETFGENPVRLYEDHREAPSTPVQDILGRIKPEKLTDLLAAALEKKLK